MKHLLQIDHETPEITFKSFERIAEQLLNHHMLRVKEKWYRITECEFYYYNESNHPDPYVHGHERQKTSIGEWYFHGSGLDITLSGNNSYGGILLRGITEVNKESIVPDRKTSYTGPLNVCTEIFKQFGSVKSEREIDFGLTYISPVDSHGALLKEAKIFSVPRVGLNPLKYNDEDYSKRPYRFLAFLHLEHREQERVKNYLVNDRKQLTEEQYNQYYKEAKCWKIN